MYLLLGLAVALALLLVVFLAGSLAILAVERVAHGWLRERANLLFALRIAPAAGAILLVAFVALPAQWIFEPRESSETIGIGLAILATLAACGIAYSIVRAGYTWRENQRAINDLMRTAERASIQGVDIPVYRLQNPLPIMAVAGILRPRLLIAGQLFDSMRPEEMAAAVAHEMGHIAARDNLRRLLLLLSGRTPDALWMEASESAADLFAARQSEQSALDLAAALVKVGRMTPAGMSSAFPAFLPLLVSDSESGLSGRVLRLVELSTPDAAASKVKAAFLIAPLICALIALLFSPASLHAMHELIELFVRLLP